MGFALLGRSRDGGQRELGPSAQTEGVGPFNGRERFTPTSWAILETERRKSSRRNDSPAAPGAAVLSACDLHTSRLAVSCLARY